MNTATPSLRATPSEEGERIPNTENPPSFERERKKNAENPPSFKRERRKNAENSPSFKRERRKNAENSPSLEGVARSDGVAVLDSMTQSTGVAAANANPKLKQLPYNPALKQRASQLRKAGNLSEALFWNAVKNRRLNGFDFDRQRVIGNYIVDFYCYELALVVEIDGSSHDDKQEYDLARDQYLEALGLKVLHVQDVDVKQNLSGVVELVLQHVAATPSLRATPSNEGEFSAFGIRSPSSEGVARSDGVAALDSMTQITEVAALKINK